MAVPLVAGAAIFLRLALWGSAGDDQPYGCAVGVLLGTGDLAGRSESAVLGRLAAHRMVGAQERSGGRSGVDSAFVRYGRIAVPSKSQIA